MSVSEDATNSSRDAGVKAKPIAEPDCPQGGGHEVSISFGSLSIGTGGDGFGDVESFKPTSNVTNSTLAISTPLTHANGADFSEQAVAPHYTTFSDASAWSSPVIVVSPERQEPFSHQLPNVICDPLDQPDPRLLDALENPRDRIFVIKLEKDLVAFIEDKSCEIFDMPPINSYHRLLAHKMAEYYRLTHVSDTTGTSVRMYRDQAARIPPTLLSQWPVSMQQQQKAASSGAVPAVKIMRRAGSDKDCDAASRESLTPRKDGSETSSDNDHSTAASASTKNTREEREAAYQEARARIFADFVESPPDTPPPNKQEKTRRQDKNDDFSGRSQFYPVLTPVHAAQYYPQSGGYHDSSMLPAMPQPAPPTQRFNPTANFTPSSQYSPSAPPFAGPPSSRSFPSYNTTRDRGYPSSQHPHQQPIFPPRNGVYPSQPPIINGNLGGNFNGYPHPNTMQHSYPSSGFPQQGLHNMQHHFNSSSTPPSISRQPQPQVQYPMHHQQPYGAPQNLAPQRVPAQYGWGGFNGMVGQLPMNSSSLAMAPRSSSAPGYPGAIDPPISMGNASSYVNGSAGPGGGGGGGSGGNGMVGGWNGTNHLNGWNGNSASSVSGIGRGPATGMSGMGGANMRM